MTMAPKKICLSPKRVVQQPKGCIQNFQGHNSQCHTDILAAQTIDLSTSWLTELINIIEIFQHPSKWCEHTARYLIGYIERQTESVQGMDSQFKRS